MIARVLLDAAVEIWGFVLPWWGWLIAAILAVLVAVVLVFMIWEWWETRSLGADDDYPEERNSEIVIPYYAESETLRSLANELKLDVPTARQVTKSKRLTIGFKSTSGEGGHSETSEFTGSIPLSKLAKALEVVRYDGNNAVTDVTDAPMVSDEGALSGAIEQIRSDFPAQSETAVLLSRVKEAFGTERAEAMAQKKRKEFERIGQRNQLLIIRGQMGLAGAEQGEAGPTLHLTHFNPTPAYVAANARTHGEREEVKADLVPVSEGVGLQVALPDASALTPAGRERLHRGQSVYVGILAHSPSFDEATGILTCSAWAVWGETMPDWEERFSESRYYGAGRRY